MPGAAAGLGQPRANQNPCVWPVQGDHAQEATKLPATPMTATNNTSIATTEVLVSPKGDMIAVAPLTNAKGSLISAYATPSLNLALFCLCHHGGGFRVGRWGWKLFSPRARHILAGWVGGHLRRARGHLCIVPQCIHLLP